MELEYVVCQTLLFIYKASSHYHCKYHHRPVITKVSQTLKNPQKKPGLCFWIKIHFQVLETININQSMFSEIKVQVTYQAVHARIFRRKIQILQIETLFSCLLRRFDPFLLSDMEFVCFKIHLQPSIYI